MVTVLTGTNTAALHNELKKRISAFTAQHGDSIERFDGSELDTVDRVIDAVRSISLLDPMKMVIVRDFAQNKELLATIDSIIVQTADSTELLLIDQRIDRRSVAFKSLKKTAQMIDFAELIGGELTTWIIETAKALGATINRLDATFLVERVGTNQQQLLREIEKLALYNETIDRTSITLLTDQAPQSKVFTMLEYLFKGDVKKSWELYVDQRSQGEEPQKLMAMITWQLQQLALAVFAPRKDSATLVAAGMSPFASQKTLTLSSRISKSQMRHFVARLAEIDAMSKTNIDIESALSVYFAEVAAELES